MLKAVGTPLSVSFKWGLGARVGMGVNGCYCGKRLDSQQDVLMNLQVSKGEKEKKPRARAVA